MKKINLFVPLLLLFLWSGSSVFGKAVSAEAAKNVGYNYLTLHGMATLPNGASDLNLVYTSGSATAHFYVFSGSKCFVIVSAEDGVIPVIGYSKERAFHGDKIPATVKGFFENYDKQIDYVINNNVAASPEIATKWNNLVHNQPDVTAVAKTTAVSPLLVTTWDQSQYYNASCPTDAGALPGYGGRCPTGCVATATAQVMKFWGWPAHGTGTHSYATSSYGTLSANFGATTYNWAAMPNNVVSSNPSVATLMSQVGISINMQYSPSESGSYVISSATGTPPFCAEYSLRTFFNYDASLHGEQRVDYSDATWISMLKTDLNAGRPIIYFGSGTGGGHCFVFDGYDASNNMHVNWGWGGYGPDGYYSIDALNPPALGTGGGSGGFNSDQGAILGVRPPTGSTSDSLALYNYVSTYTPSINYVDSFTIVSNIMNYASTGTFTGDYAAVAFDATGTTFVGVIDSATGMSLPAGYAYSAPGVVFHTGGMVSMVPGVYTVKICYRHPGGVWIPVTDNPPYTNATTVTVVNHNPIELYSAMTATPNPLVQGAAASVGLRVYNNSGTAWNDSLYLGLFNLDGSWACDIKYMGATSVGASSASGTLTFNTSNVATTPGTYLMVLFYKSSGNWYIAGADYYTNPAYINVVAPPPSPDMYEVNNTAATAYNLSSTLTWASNVAHTSTPGSNFHNATDQDYYKLVFPGGYKYTITARVNDLVSTDDGASYTVDALWSYSKDGGATWSSAYDDVMTGTINLTTGTGGTVIFHCSPRNAGSVGTYLLKISNITRVSTADLQDVELSAARIYPNPAKDILTVDLSGTNCSNATITLTDVLGKRVYTTEMNQQMLTMPLNTLASGMYFLEIATANGTINRKINIVK